MYEWTFNINSVYTKPRATKSHDTIIFLNDLKKQKIPLKFSPPEFAHVYIDRKMYNKLTKYKINFVTVEIKT